MTTPRSWFAFALPWMLGVTSLAAAGTPATRPAPGFSLPSAHGIVTLDSLRGSVVLVDFWASWCDPCRRSFPWMDSLRARYGPRGFEVVGVDLDKDRDLADAFLFKHPVSFPVVFDPAGSTAERFGVVAMPTSFLVGTHGEILLTHAGFERRQAVALEQAIQEALPR